MSDGQSDSTLSQQLQEALERYRQLEGQFEDFERVMGELREREQRWRWLAERMDEAFWLVSPDESEVRYVSPAYESIIGRSCESFRADPESWIESLHPQDKEAITAGIEKRGPGLHRDERSKEVRVLNDDGSIRWVWVRSMPVFESDGKLVARAGVALDITERKNSEVELPGRKVVHWPERGIFTPWIWLSGCRLSSRPLALLNAVAISFRSRCETWSIGGLFRFVTGASSAR